MSIDYSYMSELQKVRYQYVSNRHLDFKDVLRVNAYDDAYVLPIRNGEGKAMMGLGGVVDNDGSYIVDSGIYSRGNNISYPSDGNDIETYMGIGYSFDRSNVEEIFEEVIYCGNMINHWGHFLLDLSTHLWYASEHRENRRVVFICKESEKLTIHKNILRFLELLGIKEENILLVNCVTRFRKVIVPEPSYITNHYCSKEYLAMFDKVVANASIGSEEYDKVYFSRSGFGKAAAREFGGKLLDDMFQQNGYLLVSPELCTLDQQITYIRNSKVIAGISGTVTHNMLFANEGHRLQIVNKTYILNVMQMDVNLIRNLNVQYIDAFAALFPVTMGAGPFCLTLSKFLRDFITDNGYIISPKFSSDRFRRRTLKQYLAYYRSKLSSENGRIGYVRDWNSAHYFNPEFMEEFYENEYLCLFPLRGKDSVFKYLMLIKKHLIDWLKK